jgi:hypothetical protein
MRYIRVRKEDIAGEKWSERRFIKIKYSKDRERN